ncbi:hypothetical protein CDD81_375 [Ophiocordyceps australis]|uniref:Uncharacterized protein n=1 Tax=Ophiocordyceps australis TaxID=1399860 RepID=A0A2C5XYD6_9HYPO|nr:hypothetical protein CDD81_375 [Ophiocordyceps australis]
MREQMLVTKTPPPRPTANDPSTRRQEMLALRENFLVRQRAQMSRYQDLVEHRRKIVPPPCMRRYCLETRVFRLGVSGCDRSMRMLARY